MGQPIVQLVTPGVWVTANFKETQLEHIRTGQPVEISADAFPSVKIRGEVETFSVGTGWRLPGRRSPGAQTGRPPRPQRYRSVRCALGVAAAVSIPKVLQ